MTKILLTVLVGGALSGLIGFLILPVLRAVKAGQSIREVGPTWHNYKAGTPMMGGLMFIFGIVVAILVAGTEVLAAGNSAHLVVFLFALVFGLIGLIDDVQKLRHRANEGLSAAQKFLLQLAAAIVFTVWLRQIGYLTPNLYIPFLEVTLPLPWPVYMVFAAFVMVGTVNAVNITDGLDGLAASVTLPVMIFFTAVAVAWGEGFEGCALLCAAMCGGLLAFLVYNFYPAKTFMGDTGSLFLGGLVSALAFAYDMPLILIPVGIIYIIETLSDILQIGYFKLTHGKRIFKMAPLHHHFEMCGWKEVKVVFWFAAITVVGCAVAYLGVFQRYGM